MRISAKMEKALDRDWVCLDCGYRTKIKTNMRMHVESKHVVSEGFQCHICLLLVPNRKALRNHLDRNHEKTNRTYWDPNQTLK